MNGTDAYRVLSKRQAKHFLEVFDGAYQRVLVFDGNVKAKGNFLTWVNALGAGDVDLIVVDGDLTVAGRVALEWTYPALLVTGVLRADTLEAIDAEVHLEDCVLKYLLLAKHNDGSLHAGRIEVPYVVIDSDHDTYAEIPKAKWLAEQDLVPEVLRRGELDVPAFLKRVKSRKSLLRAGKKPYPAPIDEDGEYGSH